MDVSEGVDAPNPSLRSEEETAEPSLPEPPAAMEVDEQSTAASKPSPSAGGGLIGNTNASGGSGGAVNSTSPPGDQQQAPVDHYGFAVNPAQTDLYNIYSEIWEQEEAEREVAWTSLLKEYMMAHAFPDGGASASLEDLGAHCLQDAHVICQSEVPGSPARKRMEELVQLGVPFLIRGRAWTIFLDTSVRKQKGYYQVRGV